MRRVNPTCGRAVWPTAVLGLLAALSPACQPAGPAPPGARADGAAGAWDRNTRRFAVVVGHNRGAATRLPLRFAETDSQHMALVLRELGGVRHENLHLLLGPRLAELERAVGRVQAQIEAWRRSGDGARSVLLVYFSGHSDGTALELADERLTHARLLQLIPGTGADLRITIVDACRSGTLLAMKGGAPGPQFNVDEPAESSTGHAILASTGANEDALESVELGASFFSHHLLSGLRGAADADRDARITLNEAYAHAAARTAAETAGTVFGPQRPSYQIRLSGRGDFVLTRLPARGTILELPEEFDRVLVVDALRGTVAAEWAPGAARRLAVPAVPLLLRAWRGGRTLGLRMALAPGEQRTVKAAELVPEPEAPAPGSAAEVAPAPAATPKTDRDDPPPRERDIRNALATDAECPTRFLLDARAERAAVPPEVAILSQNEADADPRRLTLSVDVPSKRSLIRLRFEVCDPKGMWLHVSDSPSGNGGGGDSGQFSNDAELETRATGLWVWGNDYGRPGDLSNHNLVSTSDFVASSGCTRRTLVLGDQLVHSTAPRLRSRSRYGLRLDPPADHEGRPDRRWYIGFNRSVGSDRPDRMGSGLAWLELCVR